MPTDPSLLSVIPHSPGVYLMRDAAARIIYIGKAIDLRNRVGNYFRAEGLEPKTRALMAEVRHIDYVTASSEREALVIEQRLIGRHQPLYNVMWKDGKTYPYVKISVNEDYPRIFLTRQRRRDGGVYFGPYPNVSGVRHLLKGLWKKQVLRLRACDYEFSEQKPLDPKLIKSCLYYHTGQCPAPCVPKISKADYRALADDARFYFEGKTGSLRENWEKEMKEASAAMDFERAAHLRDNIAAIDHVNERVTFRALREEDVQGRLKTTQALQDLQRALNLPKPPLRIEAFDISHVQGFETVASMVSFDRGKPFKSGYRKFKIKTVEGVDDFASMEEVVFRRYKRVKEEGLRWPDLILIDGGPGQLAAALKGLKKVSDRAQPIASLAKREEEIFLPGRQAPVLLPKDSPALHVLQHVRDESHRFAVTFHRARRGKRLLEENRESPPAE
jgi:excinuclease ABC subunit C